MQTCRQTDIYRQAGGQTYMHADRKTDRETARHTYIHAAEHAGRHADRQNDIHAYTGKHAFRSA